MYKKNRFYSRQLRDIVDLKNETVCLGVFQLKGEPDWAEKIQ